MIRLLALMVAVSLAGCSYPNQPVEPIVDDYNVIYLNKEVK